MPHYSIGSGLDRFEGEERKMARFFLGHTEFFRLGESVEGFIVTGVRVTRIEKCPGAPPFDPESLRPYGTDISGEIKLYTIFGIPYDEVEASCVKGVADGRTGRG